MTEWNEEQKEKLKKLYDDVFKEVVNSESEHLEEEIDEWLKQNEWAVSKLTTARNATLQARARRRHEPSWRMK